MKIEITETTSGFDESGHYVERPNGNSISLVVTGDDANRFTALAGEIIARRLTNGVAFVAAQKAERAECQQ